MREKLSFEERLKSMQERYDVDDDSIFDLATMIRLEDEYELVSDKQPEHTKRRQEILRMRDDIRRNFTIRPIFQQKVDLYIDTYRNNGLMSFTIYCDGKMHNIANLSYKDIVDRLICIGIKNKNIFIDTIGVGKGLADELDSQGIRYKKLAISRINK